MAARKPGAKAVLEAALKETERACAVEQALIAASRENAAEKKQPEKSKRAAKPKFLTAAQLKKVVNAVPEDRRLLAKNVAEELSFMSEMLAALKKEAREIGALENFVQGRQSLLRENPALKSYNTTIKNYAVLLSKLTDLLPKATIVPEDPDADAFDSFVAGRDTD